METQNIEYKLNWRDDFLKEVCGFANAQGGILYIGVDDKGNVVGVNNAHELLEVLPNKILTTMGIVATVNLLYKDLLQYIEIRTEAHPYPINYKGAYYLRSGSTTQELKNNALDLFLLEKRGKTWDSVPQLYLDSNDLDESSLQLFRNAAIRSQRMTESDLNVSRLELLEKLHLLEGEHLKRATALLFHKDPEKYITGACIKIGYFRTNTELLYQDQVSGSLFQQVQQTIDLLTTKYMKALIRYEDIQRIDELPIPRSALREALLNAIIHKFYGSGNPIQISVYEDKLMIYNSAILPQNWTIETLLNKHNSEPSNPDIANVFFRAGEIEAWGRGIERIVETCAEYGCPQPEWKIVGNGIWIIFYYKKSEPLNAKSEPLNAKSEPLNAKSEPLGLSDTQKRVYDFIKGTSSNNDSLSTLFIANSIGISYSTAKRVVNFLEQHGLVRRIGGKKTGHWETK